MSTESGAGYMGAFQDFVQAKTSEDTPVRRPQQCQPETSSSSSSAAATSQSSSSGLKPGKKRKPESDDDDDNTETDLADDDVSSAVTDDSDSEPPAVPKRPRTVRTAKQKVLSQMSSRGRGRGVFSLCFV